MRLFKDFRKFRWRNLIENKAKNILRVILIGGHSIGLPLRYNHKSLKNNFIRYFNKIILHKTNL